MPSVFVVLNWNEFVPLRILEEKLCCAFAALGEHVNVGNKRMNLFSFASLLVSFLCLLLGHHTLTKAAKGRKDLCS